MNNERRITRKQAQDHPILQKEVDEFYTPPFGSTPIPRIKSREDSGFFVKTPRKLFSEGGESSSNSNTSDETENITIKTEQTLKEQAISPSAPSLIDSDDSKEPELSINSPADISSLYEDISKEDKMATKQTISLKDALRVIPEFNGSNIPLSQFLEGCEIAKEMIESEDEKTFVKLLRSKITGEARQVIINTSFDTIEKVKDHLKSIYRPAKSVHQLLGELGNEFQREDESVVTYANRMRDLGNQIIEASKIANGTLGAGVKESTLASVVECFKKGLKPEIEQRIKQEATIDEIMKDAIRVERLLEAQRNLRRSTKSTFDNKLAKRHIHYCIECQMLGHDSNDCKKTKYCDFCKRTGHSTEQCFKKDTFNSNTLRPQNPQPIVTCQFCNKTGHTADKCYHLINARSSNTSNQFNPIAQPNRPTCQYCGKLGHTADKCYSLKGSQDQSNNRAQLTCQICKRNGHTAAVCRSAPQNQNSTNYAHCSYCKTPGHTIQECKKREYNNARRAGNERGPQQSSVGRETSTTRTRSMNATQIDDVLEELIPLE